VTSCVVCTMHVEMESVGFLVEPQKQGQISWLSLKTKVNGLGPKTVSSGLVIWASKSPCRFLDLGLKTNQTTVCRLHHKTNGRLIQHVAHVEIWRLASPRSKSR
jgi:hypothetical protein